MALAPYFRPKLPHCERMTSIYSDNDNNFSQW
ncbi:Uncharacterised protein [Escherichia coli]|nr:Uncharacterised protein [Escherichia coli]